MNNLLLASLLVISIVSTSIALKNTFSGNSEVLRLDLTTLPAGLYILNVAAGQHQSDVRIIKN
jgi:hypothetical protein